MVKTLNETDKLVLRHVGRYRLTDAEILAHADPELNGSEGNASIVLGRLAKKGWLAPSELCPESPGHTIFCLSVTGAKLLALDAEFARPLAHESRVEWYAIAKFCCCSEVHRQLLTKPEFQHKFKEIWYPGQPVRYYLEPDGSGSARLAFIKVDKHGNGRWERLIDSCNRFLRQRTDPQKVSVEHQLNARAFARIASRGQFQFTVLTALTEKKRSIELEIERRRVAGEWVAPINTYVLPELSALMLASTSSAG